MTIERFFSIYTSWLNGEGIDFRKDGIQKAEVLQIVGMAQTYLKPEHSNTFIYALIAEVLEVEV